MSIDLISAKIATVNPIIGAGLLSGLASFSIAEKLTGNYWFAGALAGIATAVSTAVVAYFSHRHKMVSAVSGAQHTARTDRADEWAKLLTQANEIHGNALAYHRDRAKQMNTLIQAITITKHAILNENQKWVSHADYLEDLLKESGIKFEAFKPRDISKLTEWEDKIRAGLAGIEWQALDNPPKA